MEASARMAKNAATARQLAAESMVLLKNVGNTLPLLGSPEEPVQCLVLDRYIRSRAERVPVM